MIKTWIKSIIILKIYIYPSFLQLYEYKITRLFFKENEYKPWRKDAL